LSVALFVPNPGAPGLARIGDIAGAAKTAGWPAEIRCTIQLRSGDGDPAFSSLQNGAPNPIRAASGVRSASALPDSSQRRRSARTMQTTNNCIFNHLFFFKPADCFTQSRGDRTYLMF
jgi:hypothetical protein